MAGATQTTGRIRRRLLGYDRKAVDAALATAAERLGRAEARRDELIETTANVERIGAQVAEMLRSLADRAVQLEDDATAQAAEIVRAAELEAEELRAHAAAVLAAAEATAHQLVEATRRQQAAVSERRESAVISLRIAMDQMGRLATLVDEIDLTGPAEAEPAVDEGARTESEAADEPPAETVVVLPWAGSTGSAPAPAAIDPADEPIADVLARLGGWASSSS